MKLAKFDQSGKLLVLMDKVDGIDTDGFVEVADDADVNNLFLFPSGDAGARADVVLNCHRTVLISDGIDRVAITGMPVECAITVNGEPTSVNNGVYYVSSTVTGPIVVALTGAFHGNPVVLYADSAESLLGQVREERDRKLAGSDWTQLPDSSLTEDAKTKWAEYRTALRNITNDQPDANIDTVIWPIVPTKG